MSQNIFVIGCCAFWAIALIAMVIWFNKSGVEEDKTENKDKD